MNIKKNKYRVFFLKRLNFEMNSFLEINQIVNAAESVLKSSEKENAGPASNSSIQVKSSKSNIKIVKLNRNAVESNTNQESVILSDTNSNESHLNKTTKGLKRKSSPEVECKDNDDDFDEEFDDNDSFGKKLRHAII